MIRINNRRVFPLLILLLLFALNAYARSVESYDKGNIKFSDEAIAGKHEVKVGIRKPVSASEVQALMYLYMNKACGKDFLFLDMFQKTPPEGKLQTADFDFHCTNKPDFFQNDPSLRDKLIRDVCAGAEAAYLKKLCR